MNIEKASYWMALAVFGLVLHSDYRRGEFPSLHRAAARASSELCRIAAHAERTFAVTRVLTARPALNADDVLDRAQIAELAEDQAEFLREQTQDNVERLRNEMRAQAGILRAQAQTRRVQIEQIRVLARPQVRLRTATSRLTVGGANACGHRQGLAGDGPQSVFVISDDQEDSD
jgi:hypothetical protein